jgi:hypothetical protein
MQQGRGVTNYDIDKPSHALTTRTTEFDDALVKHGIVNYEQVMLAKGASQEEAARLAQAKSDESKRPIPPPIERKTKNEKDSEDDSNHDDSDDVDDDVDDEFFSNYRTQRLAQLQEQQQHASENQNVDHITRDEWTVRVNEASRHGWVLITLTDKANYERIRQELHNLIRLLSSSSDSSSSADINFLTIEATHAIPNWPSDRVPSLFAYRNGIKQHEWIAPGNGKFPTTTELQALLYNWDVSTDDYASVD